MKNKRSNFWISRYSHSHDAISGMDIQWCIGFIVVVLSAGGCRPDQGEVRAEISPAEPSRSRTKGQYQKVPPPSPPAPAVDPCDELASAIRKKFPDFYRLADSPRFAVIANVSSGDVADATDAYSKQRKENTSVLGRRPVYNNKEHVLILDHAYTLDETLPVDRSTVENLCIEFLNSVTPVVRIVDPGVVRELLRRRVNDKPPTVSQDLCEICIVLDVHIAREHPISGDRMIALTARAIRMSNGDILSVSTAQRRTVVGERNVEELMRRMCFCSGAYLVDGIIKRW